MSMRPEFHSSSTKSSRKASSVSYVRTYAGVFSLVNPLILADCYEWLACGCRTDARVTDIRSNSPEKDIGLGKRQWEDA